MRRKVMSHESVSAFCLEMALLVHAGISAEDGLYLLAEDAEMQKEEKMLTEMAQVLGEAEPLSQAVRRAGDFPSLCGRYDRDRGAGRPAGGKSPVALGVL